MTSTGSRLYGVGGQAVREHADIYIHGNPVTEGSVKACVSRSGKLIVTHDRDRELKAWRLNIAANAYRACKDLGWELPLDEPVAIRCCFYLPKPKRARFGESATKPDLDKLMRAVGDALAPGHSKTCDETTYLTQRYTVLVDDSRIVDWHARKIYANQSRKPGAWIEIIRTTRKEVG